MATSAPTFASARKRSSSASACGAGAPSAPAEDEHRGALPDAERPQPHRELLVGQPPGERLGEHVAGEPALGVAHRALAHQLERHDGHGLLEDQPLEVAEAAGVARRHEPGLRRAAAAQRDRQHERAAGDVRDGRARTRRCRPRARCRRRAARCGARPPRAPAPSPPRAPGAGTPSRRSSRRAPESTHTAPPVAAASARTTSSSPLSSSTSRSSRLWIAMPRWSTSYCSFTSRVNAFSVSAMNGSSYGTSNTGKPSSRASSTSAGGQLVVVEAGAEPEPGQVVPGEQPHELALALCRCRAGSRWSAGARRPTARASGRAAPRCAPSGPARPRRPRPSRARAPSRTRALDGEHRISGGRSGPRPR